MSTRTKITNNKDMLAPKVEYKKAGETNPTRYLRQTYHSFHTRIMFDMRSWRPSLETTPRTHASKAGVYLVRTGITPGAASQSGARSGDRRPWMMQQRSFHCLLMAMGTGQDERLMSKQRHQHRPPHGYFPYTGL